MIFAYCTQFHYYFSSVMRIGINKRNSDGNYNKNPRNTGYVPEHLRRYH
jgi:hypothetical protein